MKVTLISFANALRASCIVLLTKIVAYLYGPTGLVALGFFQNILGILGPVSSLGSNSGIILFFSKAKIENINDVSKTIAVIVLSGLIISVFLLIFLWQYFLDLTSDFFSLNFISLLIFCFSSAFYALVSGYMQGRSLFSSFAYGTIFASVINIFFISLSLSGLSINYSINIAAYQVLTNLLALTFLVRKELYLFFDRFSDFQRKIAFSILTIGALSMLSGLIYSFCSIVLRQKLIETLGLEVAGNWDAAIRIFPLITMLVCMPLFTLYFPTLSTAKSYKKVLNTYKKILRFTLFPFALGLFVVFFLSDEVVAVIFDKSFTLYADTILWFVIGDCLRAYATLINYFNLASQNYITHFLGEVIFILGLLFLFNLDFFNSFLDIAVTYLTMSLISLILISSQCFLRIRRIG